jgi:predicted CopG family antitoxin
MSIIAIGNEMAKDVTTVRISTELRDKLKKLGVKGETYEDVIQRLVEIAQKNNTGERS